MSKIEALISILLAVFGSGGFWAFVTYRFQQRDAKDSAEAQMLKGLGHDRICWLGTKYIQQGHISRDDYENLHDYLYRPYKALGGNGTAEKIVEDVKKLPIVEGSEKK